MTVTVTLRSAASLPHCRTAAAAAAAAAARSVTDSLAESDALSGWYPGHESRRVVTRRDGPFRDRVAGTVTPSRPG